MLYGYVTSNIRILRELILFTPWLGNFSTYLDRRTPVLVTHWKRAYLKKMASYVNVTCKPSPHFTRPKPRLYDEFTFKRGKLESRKAFSYLSRFFHTDIKLDEQTSGLRLGIRTRNQDIIQTSKAMLTHLNPICHRLHYLPHQASVKCFPDFSGR